MQVHAMVVQCHPQMSNELHSCLRGMMKGLGPIAYVSFHLVFQCLIPSATHFWAEI